MTRTARMLVSAVILAAALSFTACAPSFPDPPAAVGQNFPDTGIPVSVAWPSDWIDSMAGESEAVGGSIVGLRLELVGGDWVWRVRSLDPGHDVFGEQVTDPKRGREALINASTLALITHHAVELSDAELAEPEVSYYDAAQLSGEQYPSPRLIELTRVMDAGRPAWQITMYDTETGIQSVSTVGAARSGE